MLPDVKIAVRKLIRRPSFSITAVLTLAVGIGAATAIFSTVNVTLLRPLPYPAPEDIYTLSAPFVDGRWSRGRVAGAYISAANEMPSVARAVAVQTWEQIVYADDGTGRPSLVHLVSEGFFEVFGSSMAVGRPPTTDEYTATAVDYTGGGAVISHRLWTEMFGRSASVIDRPLRTSSGTVTVLGVAPAEFDVPSGTDVWIGFRTNPSGTAHNYEAYVRVRPGTSQERLDEELASAMAGLIERYPAAVSGREFATVPLTTAVVGDLGTILLIVLGGALVLLAMASVNVATLILSQGVARLREVAVRVALGAQRLWIVRSLCIESLVLATAGCAAGLILAWIGVQALRMLGAEGLPRMETIPFDGRVLAFALGVLILTTILTTLLPSIRLATPDIRGLMNEGARAAAPSHKTGRLLTGLVISEIALAVVLVSGAGWLVRSYANLTRTDLGFDPSTRLTFTANLLESRWTEPQPVIPGPDGRPIPDPSQPAASTPRTWLETLTERLQTSPQIGAVGSANTLPMATDWDSGFNIGIPGEPFDAEEAEVALARNVSAGFFAAMGTPLIAGRDFTNSEGQGVAIVNEEFVRRFLPGRDPVGASFASGFPNVDFRRPLTIIGVVADVKYASPRTDAGPIYYTRSVGTRQNVVVETRADDPSELIPWVRDEIAAVDPSIRVVVQSLDDIVGAHMVRHRLGLVLLSSFALLSLALAGIGIFGVVTHVNGLRSTELATRMAMGATSSDVGALVMRRGILVLLGGVGLGTAIALLAGRFAASRLYEVRSTDPAILVAAVVTVTAVTLVSFLVPAVRTARDLPRRGLRGALQ